MSKPHLFSMALVGPLPPPSGGMANQTRQLARLLAESKVAVELVQVNPPYVPAWVGHVPIARAAFRLLPYLFRLWRVIGRVNLVHVMANSGWAWHLFAAPAVWIAHLRGRAVVVNYRGGEAEEFLQRQHGWIAPTLRRATAVVVPSGFLQQVFAKWGVDSIIVPNIIDLSRFNPADTNPHSPHVIVTRNLEDIYDIPTAIQAFARIRRVHPVARMTIAGSGPRRADLERLCHDLGLSNAAVFTGRLDNDAMASLYRSATVMLNPSLVDNMPISVLEALASGVPIVSTNVGGVPYVVRSGETALLVPPRDPEAMADAALRIIEDRALAGRLATAGLADVRQYTWERVRVRLFQVYDQVVGAPVLRPGLE